MESLTEVYLILYLFITSFLTFVLLTKAMKNSFSASHCRKSELHQVAQQASNIWELTEVIRASLSVMSKQWSDAMHTFREKFDSLSTLIINHGNNRYYIYSRATPFCPYSCRFFSYM